MHRSVRLIRWSIGAAGVLIVLTAAAPDPAALRAGLADPDRWRQRDGLDLVLAQLVGAVAWCAALWLALGLLLVAGSRLPGAVGRASTALARGALPAGIRSAAALALGAGLATSTLPALTAATTSPAAAQSMDPRTGATRSTVDWPVGRPDAVAASDGRGGYASTVDWPVAGLDAVTPGIGLDRHAPTVDWPTAGLDAPSLGDGADRFTSTVDWPATGLDALSPGDRADHPTSTVDWPTAGLDAVTYRDGLGRPAATVDWPIEPTDASSALSGSTVDRSVAATPARSAAVGRAPGGGAAPARVVVQPGDTLWSIAARRLGPGATAPAIAVEWRHWHAANRELIGPDPRRLRSGVSLRVPGTA